MSRLSMLVCACALALPWMGCAAQPPTTATPVDPFEERKLAPEVRDDAALVVEANNAFAIDLYGRLREEPGNLFLSPYSIANAFAMVDAGARGETHDEIARVFHWSQAPERFHPAFGALQRSLDRGTSLGGYELRVANAAWLQQDYDFEAEFLHITREHYAADTREADFAHAPEPARLAANAWVEGKTQQRIRDLFPPGSINEYTRFVLANAIYFKGLWASPFDPDATRDLPFHISPDQSVAVPTMSQEGRFRGYGSEQVQVLELPYQGRDLSMLILLPTRRDGLAELEAGLTHEGLRGWIARLHDANRIVSLPRFRFGAKFDLPQTLTAMGMPSAFAAGGADLSGIDGGHDLYISAAIHQAFVEVNEKGTEAAAATGVVGGITSVPPMFTADHPFLFLIYDHVTGSILFLGRVVDPRS